MKTQSKNQEIEFKERRNGYYRFKYVRQRHIVIAFVLVILSVSFMQQG